MVAALLHFHDEMDGQVHEDEFGKIKLIQKLLDRHILKDVLVYDRLEYFGPAFATLLHSSKPFLCSQCILYYAGFSNSHYC